MSGTDETRGVVLLTGCTGFLGRRIVRELAATGRPVFLPAERDDLPRAHALVARLARRFPGSRGAVTLFAGDLAQPALGLDPAVADRILAEADVWIHARFAGPSPSRPPARAAEANVRAVEGMLAFAHRSRKLRVFALAGGVGVAGDYPGTFYEDWLDAGQEFADPLDRALYDMEVRVRHARRTLPVLVFRSGIIVGDSETGDVERDGGLGPLVRFLSALQVVPRWLPLPGPEGDRRVVPISPVDYVARGALALTASRDNIGLTFCLADPEPPSLRELLDTLTDALSVPRTRALLPAAYQAAILRLPGVMSIAVRAGDAAGIPLAALRYLASRNRHDTARARDALGPAGVSCPPLGSYLPKILASHLRAA
ncbi:MAG: SDR family oxidoreductase [Myxococcota bacterium]|nr:SDR family oxidoreductase [Myxococcota bacterium]